MSSGNVNVTDLPEGLLLNVFSFLDAEDLLTCAGVNATWNELTNRMSNEFWFESCLKAGIYVEEDKYRNARDWKAFLSSMLPRLKAMQDSSCFTADQCAEGFRITALYCHKDKIAIAFSYRIQIRKVCEEVVLHELDCGFKPTHLKFDDKILVAVSRVGIVRSWSTTTGNFLGGHEDTDESTLLICFDFLTDYNIVASNHLSGGNSNFIRVWRVSSDNVYTVIINRTNRIERVILAPNPDRPVNEDEITCYLFSMTIDYVDLTTVTLQNGNLSFSVTASLEIPLNLFPLPFEDRLNDRSLWGLLFDGNEVYIASQFIPFSTRFTCAWNFRTNKLRFLENLGRMTKLLDVGEKYMVYEANVENYFKRVIVANKITVETIATIRMHRSTDVLHDDHLCLADTSWLDGINGQNDRGPVCVRIAEDKFSVIVTHFVPRNV